MKKNENLNRKPAVEATEEVKAEITQPTENGGGNTLQIVQDAPEVTPVEEPVQPLAKPEPAALTIADKLKHVEMLHRKALQRENLIRRAAQLEEFEIMVSDDADELDPNIYQSCSLSIYDDSNTKFTVKSPGLISMVVEFIKTACTDKIKELENEIVFPA